jgi:hypothetical protein
MKKAIVSIMLIFALTSLTGSAIAQNGLAENLKIFEPFVGKTWKGEFQNSTPEKPVFDVSRWERALNGQAVRVLHSVNNGEYGGESIILWDAKKQSLVFYYFTTAGFYTNGTMKVENNKFISHEYVSGNQDGVTEVKATGEVTPDGKLISKSQYLKNGKWVDGHAATYVEDATAQVVFK